MQVQASAEGSSWRIVSHSRDKPYIVRVGSCFEPFKVICHDRYNNCVVFNSVPKLTVKLSSNSKVIARTCHLKVILAPDKSFMEIKDVVAESTMLDDIRPHYKATLDISTVDKAFSVAFPCQVLPGTPQKIKVHPQKQKRQLIPDQIIQDLLLEVFDKYGNHAKEDDDVLLSVDGFSFQEGSGVIHSDGKCLKKVNADGYVDLSNILKVSRGYGKDASLTVISEEKTILQLNFHTEIRTLQSEPMVFKDCVAGSTIKDVEFKVIDSNGNVDESIHDEEKHRRSHTLTIKSNSLDIDDCVRYSFRRGRCIIRSIPLPQTKGIFSFSAVHSRYPELNLTIEVHVKETLEENRDFNVDCGGDVGYPVSSLGDSSKYLHISPTSPFLKGLHIPPASPLLKDLRAGHKDSSLSVSNKYFASPPKDPKLEDACARNKEWEVMPVQVSASQEMENLEELVDDAANWGMIVVDHERKLEALETIKSGILKKISDLQARDFENVSSICGQEWISEQIKSNTQSAAAVICKLLEEPFESRPSGILGIVALLGSTESIELSRVLAKYLGEDLMLAIVCENYAAAFDLDRNVLHELARKVGQSISGGYQALCLEDIRLSPLSSIGTHNQLSLQPPTLPTGGVPQGFLGYAVNMISTETCYLQWRSSSGHGLRETLFHRLFGELQVYRDRECMMKAKSCINDGAVSMDGSFIKGNGLVSLGNWDPVIIFPVKNRAVSPYHSKTRRLLEASNLELMYINQQIHDIMTPYLKDREMLQKSLHRYTNSQCLPPKGSQSASRSSLHHSC